MVKTRGGGVGRTKRTHRSDVPVIVSPSKTPSQSNKDNDEELYDEQDETIVKETKKSKNSKPPVKALVKKKTECSKIPVELSRALVVSGEKRKKGQDVIKVQAKQKKRKLKNEKLCFFDCGDPLAVETDGNLEEKMFKTRCRPLKLVELMSEFSEQQIKDVNDIGFGGLLKIRLTRTSTAMLGWLVDFLDHGSCMFTVDDKKDFVVSQFDVYDVFCLPLNPSKDVEEISRCANDMNPDYPLKLEWRRHFGLENENDQISLGLVEARIPKLTDGGEEFKQLFVMHAFSSFLAPTTNRSVDLRIAKSLVDVDQIRTYNWSKYVLDRLCEAVENYKTGDIEWFCGCALMLEIIYFHRLRFRNVVLDSTLPLIQHWTNLDIAERIKKEKQSKRFGCRVLESTYPVSQKLEFVDGQVVHEEQVVNNHEFHKDSNEGNNGGVNQSVSVEAAQGQDSMERKIRFKLPPGSMSDEEIRSKAVDKIYEVFMFMRRDMEVVSNFYMEKIKEKLYVPPSNAASSSSSPPLTESQAFLMDPYVHSIIDEICGLVIWVKNLPGGLDNIATVEFGEDYVGHGSEKVDDCNAENILKEVLNDVNRDYGRDEGICQSVPKIGFENVLINGKSKCSLLLDASIASEKIVFVFHFVKSNIRDLRILSSMILEIVDYCMVNDICMVSNEILVSYHETYMIPRNEFYSLGEPSEDMFTSIVDCWALLLNENQKTSKGGARKLFFVVSLSDALLEVATKKDNNTQEMDHLNVCWEQWLEILWNKFDFSNLELIFVPVLRGGHFFLYVINLKKAKVQFLDNRFYDKEDMAKFEKLSDTLCDMMSTFLDQRLPERANSMAEYSMCCPSSNWKSGKENRDCGVYVMISMLLYDGEDVFTCDLLRTAPIRRVLRAQIAAALVLSDVNGSRGDVLAKLLEFKSRRAHIFKDVEQRRKKTIEEKKRRLKRRKGKLMRRKRR